MSAFVFCQFRVAPEPAILVEVSVFIAQPSLSEEVASETLSEHEPFGPVGWALCQMKALPKWELGKIWDMSVGFSGFCALRVWGKMLLEVFGDMPYQVGSSTTTKNFRDVDVVVMMSPEKFYSWVGPHGAHGARWQAVCAAFSAWGKELTGLPIDFKIQIVTEANEQHSGRREALGVSISPDWVNPECPLDPSQLFFPSSTDHIRSLSKHPG